MNAVQEHLTLDPQRLPGAFGLEPQPYVGGWFSKKGSRNELTKKAWRTVCRAKVEAWLRANGWTQAGENWISDRTGPLAEGKAVWCQLLLSWHEKIALEARAKPAITRPPFVAPRAEGHLRRAQHEPAERWLTENGATRVNTEWGWYVPGSKAEWSIREAYRILFDRWLTLQAELLAWDWAGFCGHPRSFVTPAGRNLSRAAAIRELFGT